MDGMERRAFLSAAIAAAPLALFAQSVKTSTPPKAVHVANGEDRLGERQRYRRQFNGFQGFNR